MKPKYIFLFFASLVATIVLCGSTVSTRGYWPTDSWQASSPEKHNMDPSMLNKIDQHVEESLPITTSVIIVKDGYIVFERYYLGDKNTLRPAYSTTKSVLSALVGQAIQKGYIKGLDQPMIEFFPEFIASEMNADIRKITIKHLLTMTSGITRDEQDSQVNQEVMRKPLRNEPGKEFFYGERGPQLLSMIITKATEEKAADFCKKNLFEPLGIKNFDWTYEFSGGVQYTQGGYGLQLTSRDLAKIGFLYLNNGIWADEQIVPESWISESVRGRVIVPDPKKGVSAYGLFWWIQPSVAYPSYMAVGWGGQFIYVVPSLDIVCVITTLDTGDNTFDYLTIVDDYVMPSARK